MPEIDIMGELKFAIDYMSTRAHIGTCPMVNKNSDRACSCGLSRVRDLLEKLSRMSGEHIVTLSLDGWVCEHSLQCRMDGEMAVCYSTTGMAMFWDDIHSAMLRGDVYRPGKYRATVGPRSSFNLNRVGGQ